MTTLSNFARRAALAGGIASAFALGNASLASAQEVAADSRWEAWIGCWEVVDSQSTSLTATSRTPLICVTPASGTAAVEVATVIGDSVALVQRIEATGQRRDVTKDGCTGWERAEFSSAGERVYMRSAFSCSGGLTRTSNGVMAMSQEGEWLDILGVVAGSTTGVRVARYRQTTDLDSLPAHIALALKGRAPAMNHARMVAMAPLDADDVVEASRFLDPGVVQTWIAERGDGFVLDAKRLVTLEKSGVAPVVIDVMVALSYPAVFALDRSRVGGPAADESAQVAGSGRTVYVYGWDPYYSSYGYRYGGYGYGYGYGGWYYGNRPVVIVRQPSNDEAREHGRVVKGRGYVRGGGGDRRSGSAGSRETGSSGSASSGSGSSSSGTAAKSPSSGGTTRTAKPRPPK